MPFSFSSSRLTLAVLAALLVLVVAASDASAATKITRATAVDADADGSVDGFDVTFSAKLRGKARSGGSLPFRVSGYRVTSVAKPRGRRVRLRVAESSGCDLGAKPKISYRGGGLLTNTRKRRLRRSRIDLGRRDRRAPRITCAVTGDGDRDGHIDSVVLTYSRPVRMRAASGPGPFGVDRYSISSVAAAKGRSVTLRLKEKATFDTGEVPAIFYRRPRKASKGVRATAKRRGAAASITYNDTRDRAVARLVSARTDDASLNGLVDGVVARFSEPVKADPKAIAVDGARVVSVVTHGRDGFVATVAEGPLRSDARPQVSFGTAGKLVRDLAGNAAPRTAVRAADGAAPVVTAVRTLDRTGIAGRLDTLSLTWSEPVSHPVDSDGSYPFGVTGYPIASAGASSGTALDLSVVERSTPDSGVRPPVGYTRGAGTPVRDAAGNEAASQVFAGATDGIIPRLLAANTLDTNANGRLDRIRYEFTEPVSSPARACPVCGFSTGSLTAAEAYPGSADSVEVRVAESGLNGGLEPIVSYAPASGGTVRDSSGNAAPAGTTLAADAAPPVAIAAHTADASSNAKIDRVHLTFSEPLSYLGDSTAPFSLTAGGYEVASVDPSSSTALTVRLVEKAAPDTGSAPAIGYTGLGGVDLRDANGVEHASRSWPNLTRDDVAPTFVGGRTADLNAVAGNVVGMIDAVELVYSEAVTGTANPAFFAVPGRSIDSVAFDSQSVKIRIAEAGGFDTDATVPVTYLDGPGDVKDLPEGPGDTADDAPGANAIAVDGAAPAIVAAQTADTGGPDGVIDHLQMTFSEPVDYTAGATPAVSLAAPSLSVTGATQDSPTQLTAAVLPELHPNGGAVPSVTVDPVQVTDLAATPNGARPGAYTSTTDAVRPVLVSVRLGEQAGSACGIGLVDGMVDCVRATWSEPVKHPAPLAPMSLTPFGLTSLLDPGAGPDVDAAFPQGSTPDRDTAHASFSYAAGGAEEVLDMADNPSLAGGALVGPACADNGSEPNDSRDPGNPELTSATNLEAICAGDHDWYRINPDTGGAISVRVDPNQALATEVELRDPSGTLLETAPANAAGLIDVIQRGGLGPQAHYLHVSAGPNQEGDYCIDITHVAGEEECDDGDPQPQ